MKRALLIGGTILGFLVIATFALGSSPSNEVPVYRNGPQRPASYPRLADCPGGLAYTSSSNVFSCAAGFDAGSLPSPVNCVGLFNSLQYDAGTRAYQCASDPTPSTCSGAGKALNYSAGSYSCQSDAVPVNCTGTFNALQYDAGAGAFQCATDPTPTTCSGAGKALNYSGGAYSCQTDAVAVNCVGTQFLQYDGGTPAFQCVAGSTLFDYTDTSGTPGNGTANTRSGKSTVAAIASSVTITNSYVSTSSVIMVTPYAGNSSDGHGFYVVPASGSFTLNLPDGYAIANWTFAWVVLN